MRMVFHAHFKKRYQKLRPLQKHIDEKLLLFGKNPFDPILNNHSLQGKFLGYRSINITGDYRAIFRLLDDDTALFVEVDTHGNLYK